MHVTPWFTPLPQLNVINDRCNRPEYTPGRNIYRG